MSIKSYIKIKVFLLEGKIRTCFRNKKDYFLFYNLGAGIVPKRIQPDNDSEFISKEMDRWAYEPQVTMDYSRQGKPTDNPLVESFNGSFRDEFLNAHLEDATQKIEAWRKDYNEYRPHSPLDNLTPMQFIDQCRLPTIPITSLPAAPPSDKLTFSTAEQRSAFRKKSSLQTKGLKQ